MLKLKSLLALAVLATLGPTAAANVLTSDRLGGTDNNIHVADTGNVPEPASLTILGLGLGLAGIGALRRRYK